MAFIFDMLGIAKKKQRQEEFRTPKTPEEIEAENLRRAASIRKKAGVKGGKAELPPGLSPSSLLGGS